jgi:hypothetical protein
MAGSYKEAVALGLKTYFTGVPCKRGGVAERRLNGDCLCEKCKEFTQQLKAKWSLENKEKAVNWRKNNPEKMNAYKKAWALRNKEKAAENIKKWKDSNPDKMASYTENRRAAKLQRIPKWNDDFDSFVFEEAAKIAMLRTKLTGVKWSVDHMIPLQAKTACGLHTAQNIQVIPSCMNFSKINRMVFTEPLEWIGHL